MPPLRGWCKCRCTRAFSLDNNESGCGGIFRNDSGDFLLAFVEKLSSGSSLFAKFYAILITIDMEKDRGLRKLWIEIDWIMIVKAFSNRSLAPRDLRNKWLSITHPCNISNLLITYIFREGNSCANFVFKYRSQR